MWPLILVGVLIVAAVSAFGFMQARSGPTRDVAMPPDDASAARVVRVFVDALDAHDFKTASQLLVPEVRSDFEHGWFEDVNSKTGLHIGKVTSEKPRWSGHEHGEEVTHPVRSGCLFSPQVPEACASAKAEYSTSLSIGQEGRSLPLSGIDLVRASMITLSPNSNSLPKS